MRESDEISFPISLPGAANSPAGGGAAHKPAGPLLEASFVKLEFCVVCMTSSTPCLSTQKIQFDDQTL